VALALLVANSTEATGLVLGASFFLLVDKLGFLVGADSSELIVLLEDSDEDLLLLSSLSLEDSTV
jgi:hypothetical protein